MSNLVQYRRDRKPQPHELLFMYRQRAGLTQLELADLLELKSAKMMQLWENGYRLPAAPRLKRLMEVYYQRSVFNAGREIQEVRELWASVKDNFDARAESYQTYPIFDEPWFEDLPIQKEEKSSSSDGKTITGSPNETPDSGVNRPETDSSTQVNPAAPLHLTRPNNLPAPATPLIGREAEVERVYSLLCQPETRLLTVTGPGGIGKTRLALQSASRLLAEFEDGVFFVGLAALTDPALVLGQVAKVLDIQESGNLLQSLKDFLQNRRMLLVLDNFEQVVTARDGLGELLAAAPGVKLLVTSRILLRLYGEQEFSLTPLQLPEAARLGLGQLAANASVKLFVERARQYRPEFILTAANAESVAWICLRLEGLPLALELASSWLKLFSPQLLLEKLEAAGGSRLQMLTGGPRNLAARQQTMRNTLEWSYNLLEPDLQQLFFRLAVFQAGGDLKAASVSCSPFLSELQIIEGISRLVDHSLIRIVEIAHNDEGDLRFEMLETIREYGLEKLVESGLEREVRQAHATYYLDLLKEAQPQLLTPQQTDWLDRLERDHPNLRAALEWNLADGENSAERAQDAVEMGVVLSIFWNMHGHLSEGRQWLKLILAKTPANRLDLRARLANNAALLASRQGESPEAARLLGEALSYWRTLDDRRNISIALNNLGIMAYQRGDLAEARVLYAEGLIYKRELGEPRGLAVALNNLGEVVMSQGDYTQARSLFEESLAILQQLGDTQNTALASINLGKVALLQNQAREALSFLTESLDKLLQIGDKFNLAENLEVLAQTLTAPEIGEYEWAVRLAGTAAALREEIGAPLQPGQREGYDRALSLTRENLAPEVWQDVWKAGRETPFEELGQEYGETIRIFTASDH